MLKRKDDVVGQNTKGIEFLFRKNKITWAKGRGTLQRGQRRRRDARPTGAPPTNIASYQAKNVIIATGSVPIELPFLKFDEERVLSNIGALKIPEVPKHLIVIGGGVIGLELGIASGADSAPRSPSSSSCRRFSRAWTTTSSRKPTAFSASRGSTSAPAPRSPAAGATDDGVFVDSREGRQARRIEATTCSSPSAASPSLAGIDAPALGLTLGKRGEILVDDQMRTNLPNVFAIGDCVPGPDARAQGRGRRRDRGRSDRRQAGAHALQVDPGVVYTWPEIATVGLTENAGQGERARVPHRQVPVLGQRARALDGRDGRLREVHRRREDRRAARRAHDRTERLGADRRGRARRSSIAASSEDIGVTVHAHPTLSEATKEAALAALGRAMHI